jgi:hypothetical protein
VVMDRVNVAITTDVRFKVNLKLAVQGILFPMEVESWDTGKRKAYFF